MGGISEKAMARRIIWHSVYGASKIHPLDGTAWGMMCSIWPFWCVEKDDMWQRPISFYS